MNCYVSDVKLFIIFRVLLTLSIYPKINVFRYLLDINCDLKKTTTFFLQLTAVNDKMAEYTNTPGASSHNAALMHTLQRHRDILQVHTIISLSCNACISCTVCISAPYITI